MSQSVEIDAPVYRRMRAVCDLCEWRGRWVPRSIAPWHHAVMHQLREHRERTRTLADGWASVERMEASGWLETRVIPPEMPDGPDRPSV